jgi:hypothetical protein
VAHAAKPTFLLHSSGGSFDDQIRLEKFSCERRVDNESCAQPSRTSSGRYCWMKWTWFWLPYCLILLTYLSVVIDTSLRSNRAKNYSNDRVNAPCTTTVILSALLCLSLVFIVRSVQHRVGKHYYQPLHPLHAIVSHSWSSTSEVVVIPRPCSTGSWNRMADESLGLTCNNGWTHRRDKFDQ